MGVKGDWVKVLSVAVLLLVNAATLAQSGIYRAPNIVPGLPEEIRNALEKQGCQIPLGVIDHANVIKGSFAKQGQIDWAVLCSVSGQSHIQIFWGGPASCPNQIATHPDKNYLFRAPGGNEEYYRGLGVVGKEFILSHHGAYGGPTPPPITHDGIDDRYLEKASVVHYCHKGKWQQLTGAD